MIYQGHNNAVIVFENLANAQLTTDKSTVAIESAVIKKF